MTKNSLLIPLLAASMVAGSVGIAGARSEAFDGRWAVEIVPQNGDCRTRTVALSVDEGEISYVGFGAKASGAVEEDGDLTVQLVHREKVVNASGSVDASTGAGSWVSPDCTGTWTARRS